MIVVLDSNAVYGDGALFEHAVVREILDLLGPAGATLVVSRVVLAELERQYTERVHDDIEAIKNRVSRLGRLVGQDVSDRVADVVELGEQAEKRWHIRLEEVLTHPNVERGSWPAVDLEAVARRDLERRRPFTETSNKTTGFRDAVLWEEVRALATRHPASEIVLVSADHGFRASKAMQFHQDLVDDLIEDGRDPKTVRILTSPAALKIVLQENRETRSSWRHPAIADEMHALLHEFEAHDFAATYDAREGDLSDPSFEIGLTRLAEDWTIQNVDGPEELEITDDPQDPDVARCNFRAIISFDGFMDRSTWWGGEHDGVELWDADWNEHYVEVQAHRTVDFEVKLVTDDDSEDVSVESVEVVRFTVGW